MALETNRYAVQKGVSNWGNTTIAEMWMYLDIILLMGIRRLPRNKNYWSRDKFMGIPDCIGTCPQLDSGPYGVICIW